MGDTPPLDTPDLDTLVLVTAVVTLDSATEVTPVWEVTTASVRPSPRLMPRLIPTTALDTPDLATAVAMLDSAMDTAVATDTSDKEVPVLQSTKALQDQRKAERLQLNA